MTIFAAVFIVYVMGALWTAVDLAVDLIGFAREEIASARLCPYAAYGWSRELKTSVVFSFVPAGFHLEVDLVDSSWEPTYDLSQADVYSYLVRKTFAGFDAFATLGAISAKLGNLSRSLRKGGRT
jgi:hypothetical protein